MPVGASIDGGRNAVRFGDLVPRGAVTLRRDGV
jgi:hypothetical protein